jgi:GTPase SAR1 family protein
MMMNDRINEEETLISVVVLGKGVVGKTSLIYRVVNNSFPDAHDATIEDK